MADRIPDFPWAGLYYTEILQALKDRKAAAIPEHTETGDADPLNNVLEFYAFLGHRGSVLLDHVAQEALWPTARLRSSFLPWSRLIGYPMAGAGSAFAEVLADLSGPVSGTVEVWKAGSATATRSAPGQSPIVFELQDGPISVTDTGTFEVREDDGGTVTTPSWPWAPFAGSGAIAVGDAVYIGHGSAMFQAFRQPVLTVGLSERPTFAWEYRDDRRELTPDAVVDAGASIEFDVSTLLTGGQSVNLDGAIVRVRCLATGSEETVAAVYSGGTHTATTGTLGQVAISANLGDYRVSAEWVALPAISDGTITAGLPLVSWERTGVVSWELPDRADRRWARETVDGVEGFWIRARCVSVGGARSSSASLGRPEEHTSTIWTVRGTLRQGETVNEPLQYGPSNPDLRLTRSPIMAVDAVTVDGEAWGVVSSLLYAGPSDRVVRVREEFDGTTSITFGDGQRGAVPGGNVVAIYRVGGADDGNVGPGEIRVDRSGNTRIRNLRNPAPADGWSVAEGATPEDLELLRDRLPASLAALHGAIGPEDYQTVAEAFRLDGAQVVARAIAIEEGHGLKTVEVVCVGTGGAVPTSAELDALKNHINGTPVGLERIGGLSAGNTRGVPTAYTPRVINVVGTLSVLKGYGATAEAAAKVSLGETIRPTARRLRRTSDGRIEESAAYQWRLGGTVELTTIAARVALSVPGFVDLSLGTPAANVTLGSRELPVLGTVTLAIVEIEA